MPDAIAGDGDADGYRFTTDASREDIQSYYELEPSKLGWNLLTVGESGNGSLIMFYTGSEGTLSVSIIPNGDGVIVLIVK